MRRAATLLLLLACKRQPDTLDVSGGYFEPITHLELSTVRVVNGSGDFQTVEGTLSVAIRPADGGAALCEGSVELQKSAYQPRYGDQKPEAAADVPLSKGTCPAAEKDRYVVVTTLTRKDGVPPSVEESPLDRFTKETAADVLSSKVSAACGRKALDEVKALREQVRPALEAGIKAYAPPLQRAVAAMLAKDDPCDRVLDVYVGDIALEGSPDWSKNYLASNLTFEQLVHVQKWPVPTALADDLAAQLKTLGGGWLWSSVQTGSPTGNAVTLSYRVGSSGAVSMFGSPLPALYLSGSAHVAVPGALDETFSLGTVQFQAAGQQVKYTDRKLGGGLVESGAAGAAVELMATDLIARFNPRRALQP